MNDLIIILFHGSKKLKEYEIRLIEDTKLNYPDYDVCYTYYSPIFSKYAELKLDDLLQEDRNIFINFIILSQGHNYQKVVDKLQGVYYTRSLLSYSLDYLEKDILYIGHGPDNKDYLKVKEKYPLLYLSDLHDLQTDKKIKPLFLSRSHHAMEVINSGYDVIDEVLLENENVIRLIHQNLGDLINENKNRN